MASSIMISLRVLSMLLLALLLAPSTIEARVGGTASAEKNNDTKDHGTMRKLAGGYGRKPNHNGHWNQNRWRRPTRRPVARPTRRPVVPPTPSFSTTTRDPTPVPTVKLTTAPTDAPVLPVTPSPTEAPPTDAPTKGVPPTFNPAIVVDISQPKPEIENPIFEPIDVDLGANQTVTITFEPTEISARLAAFALSGGAEFEDPTSYQFAALKRVEEQVGAEDMPDIKLLQYYALYCIFAATNAKTNTFLAQSRTFGDDPADIPGWKITSGWTENNLDPCEGEWYGISCVNDQVVNVDLFDNGLTGNFAPEIKLLAGDGFYATGAGNLISLDIFNNELMSNNGDNSWIADLGSQLGYLYLQNTGFSGKLPPRFPEGLVELDIANSLITGDLDGAAFENLSSLRFLLMDGVQFDSSIPSEISSLPNLEYFFAADSMITGDLSYMESMPMIFEHWVDRNPKLGGQIPTFIGTLTTLQSFSLAECAFTGTIPESLGNLGLMQQMWLYGNQLSGEIPASIGNLNFMRIFEVEGNNLSDSMPDAICENFSTGMLEVLGADCALLDCPCCTCCSIEECQEEN